MYEKQTRHRPLSLIKVNSKSIKYLNIKTESAKITEFYKVYLEVSPEAPETSAITLSMKWKTSQKWLWANLYSPKYTMREVKYEQKFWRKSMQNENV